MAGMGGCLVRFMCFFSGAGGKLQGLAVSTCVHIMTTLWSTCTKKVAKIHHAISRTTLYFCGHFFFSKLRNRGYMKYTWNIRPKYKPHISTISFRHWDGPQTDHIGCRPDFLRRVHPAELSAGKSRVRRARSGAAETIRVSTP